MSDTDKTKAAPKAGGRGARFQVAMDDAAAALNASVDFDRRLLRDDVRGSQAHARMLAAVVARGTGQAANIPGRGIAGKTGTTQDFRDAWFIGDVPGEQPGGLIIGVWLGNDDGHPM